MHHILYQILKIILSISPKKHETMTDNPQIRIYVSKIENRIRLKIKAGYYVKFLMPETLELLENTKIKMY